MWKLLITGAFFIKWNNKIKVFFEKVFAYCSESFIFDIRNQPILLSVNYNFEIQKILLRLDNLIHPDDKLKLLKQAVNIADSNNDIEWGYELRERLIGYDAQGIARNESFPAFAWMLNTVDNHPELFDGKDILINYRWMVSLAISNALIPFEQINRMMEDYRQRLCRAGFSLRSYYDLQIDICLFLGDAVKARENIKCREKQPHDFFSSDNELLTDICVEMLDNNFEKGIQLTNEYVSRQHNNNINLFSAYTQLVYYFNKARDERAKLYFDKSEEIFNKLEKNPHQLFELTLMIYYASRYEKEKAWDYFEKYSVWEVGANHYSSFDFSLAILPLLTGGESREMNLPAALPYYRSNNIYAIQELYDYYYKKAVELARQIDGRNGNTYHSDQIIWHLQD